MIDATRATAKLVTHVAHDAPVVLVSIVLPEFATDMSEAITAGPLVEAEALELLRSLVGEAPANDRIVAQADGNPLFLIETARMLREGGSGATDALRVPATIRGLLAAARSSCAPPRRSSKASAGALPRTIA